MAGNKGSKRKKAPPGARETGAGLPLVFGMSTEQAARLKRIPIDSLNMFQEKKASKIDSTNLYLRLITGLHIVEHVIVEDGIDELLIPLRDSITAMRSVMYRNENTPQAQWSMSPGEFELIINALDIVDQLQDQITRREMLMSFRAAQASVERGFRMAHPHKPVPKETHQQIVVTKGEENDVRTIAST